MKFMYLVFALGLVLPASLLAQEGDYIMLVDPLDEPEFYCFDLAGWGQSLQLDDPLQNHTCKLNNAADQMFAFKGNRLEVVGHDRCVQAGGSSGVTLPGSAVLARQCSADSPMQDFYLSSNGQIVLGDTGYCIGSGAQSKEASGPSHLWRTLTMVECSSAAETLTSWQIGMN